MNTLVDERDRQIQRERERWHVFVYCVKLFLNY